MNEIRNSYPDIDLPEGWIWCKLREISKFVRGVSYKGDEASLSQIENFIPILRAGNIKNELVFDDLVYVPTERVKQDQLIKAGDIVIAMSSGSKDVVGKAAQAFSDWHGSFGTFCGVLRPKMLMNRRFIGLFFQTKDYRDRISSLSFGVNINNLRQDIVLDFILSIPPLPEQRLVVSRVEILLERLRKTKESVERVRQIIKRFRQAVLKKAFSGELTADWRSQHQDLEPAIELLKRIQEERIRRYEDEVKQAKAEGRRPPKKPKYLETEPLDTSDLPELPELPEGWAWIKLGQVIRTSDERVNPNELSNELYIGLEHMESNTTKIIALGQVSEVRSTKTRFRKGDILYGKLRPYLNKACIPDFDGVCSTDILVFQCMPSVVNAYLLRFLTTREFVAYSNQNMSGIQLPRVSFDKLAVFPIPLPPLSEQSEIVCHVESLFKFADEAEKRVKEAKRRVEKITQSILAKAFRGELSADFREAFKNWKSLDLEERKKYIFTLSEDEREKALYADGFPLESAERLLERIQEERSKREQDVKSTKTKKKQSYQLIDFHS